jgi:hypothetical protein
MQSLLAKMILDLARQPKDIWRLSAPAALLNGVSLLEYSQYYGDHPDLLAGITIPASARDRMIACVKWYISTLFGSYGSRSGDKRAGGGFERKPYNPIIGEQFHCQWPGDSQLRTGSVLHAEQVSHHPPISAFYLKTENGVHVHGFTGQTTSFNGTGLRVKQEGRLFVYLAEWNEEVTITLPELHLFGIATGPYLEITGPAMMLSTSGWAADLEFEKSGFLFGERDIFSGVIYNNDTGIVDIDLWGHWKKDTHFTSHEKYVRNGKRDGKMFFSHSEHPIIRPTVAPISEQHDRESRRVWSNVTLALLHADYDEADRAKAEIEDRERAIRKDRQTPFTPALFKHTDSFYFLPMTDCDDVIDDDALDDRSTDNYDEDDESDSAGSDERGSSSSSVDSVPYAGRWLSRAFIEEFRVSGV